MHYLRTTKSTAVLICVVLVRFVFHDFYVKFQPLPPIPHAQTNSSQKKKCCKSTIFPSISEWNAHLILFVVCFFDVLFEICITFNAFAFWLLLYTAWREKTHINKTPWICHFLALFHWKLHESVRQQHKIQNQNQFILVQCAHLRHRLGPPNGQQKPCTPCTNVICGVLALSR